MEWFGHVAGVEQARSSKIFAKTARDGEASARTQ
jgi:hypothetical protein